MKTTITIIVMELVASTGMVVGGSGRKLVAPSAAQAASQMLTHCSIRTAIHGSTLIRGNAIDDAYPDSYLLNQCYGKHSILLLEPTRSTYHDPFPTFHTNLSFCDITLLPSSVPNESLSSNKGAYKVPTYGKRSGVTALLRTILVR
jgi:hypothetical protein